MATYDTHGNRIDDSGESSAEKANASPQILSSSAFLRSAIKLIFFGGVAACLYTFGSTAYDLFSPTKLIQAIVSSENTAPQRDAADLATPVVRPGAVTPLAQPVTTPASSEAVAQTPAVEPTAASVGELAVVLSGQIEPLYSTSAQLRQLVASYEGQPIIEGHQPGLHLAVSPSQYKIRNALYHSGRLLLEARDSAGAFKPEALTDFSTLMNMEKDGRSVANRLGVLAKDWKQPNPNLPLYILERTLTESLCSELNKRATGIERTHKTIADFVSYRPKGNGAIKKVGCVGLGNDSGLVVVVSSPNYDSFKELSKAFDAELRNFRAVPTSPTASPAYTGGWK